VPIVLITAIGSPKKVNNNRAGKYVLLVDYHLEGGAVEQSPQYFRLLRDAKAFATSLPAAPKHETAALFHDDKYVGTQTTFHLGR
jgi:hypothetical protein